MEDSLKSWGDGHRRQAADLLRKCWDIGRKEPHCQTIIESMKGRVPSTLKAATVANTAVMAAKSVAATATLGAAATGEAMSSGMDRMDRFMGGLTGKSPSAKLSYKVLRLSWKVAKWIVVKPIRFALVVLGGRGNRSIALETSTPGDEAVGQSKLPHEGQNGDYG